jgi:hypothetical protein
MSLFSNSSIHLLELISDVYLPTLFNLFSKALTYSLSYLIYAQESKKLCYINLKESKALASNIIV